MKPLIRIFLAIALSIGLALAGHASAQMRTMPDPAGRMVLCTGSGPVMVYVDEDGQPTSPPHYCPDCLAQMLVALVGADQPDAFVPVSGDVSFDEPVAPVLVSSPLHATARGPPASV